MLEGVEGDRIERARKRGKAYQCLRCFSREGKRTVDIKCRIEDHIMKMHLALEEVPFYCKLCSFRCQKKEQLLQHVSGYSRHVLLAAKYKIIDHSQCLMENRQPHVFGPQDYRVLTATDSLLHFLGVQAKGSVTSPPVPTSTQETWTAQAIPKQTLAVTPSNKNVATADNSLVMRTAPTVLQGDLLRTPSVSTENGSHFTMATPVQNPSDQQNFASQLTAFLQSMLAPQSINMQGEHQETLSNTLSVSDSDLDQTGGISSSGTVATMTESYQPSAANSTESSTEKTAQYIPTPMDNITSKQSIDKGVTVKPKKTKTFVLNVTEEDVLDLEDDDHMSLASAGKRKYESEDPLEEIKNAKPKTELPVNMEELSTKALVNEVGKFRESVEKNTMVATKLEKSLVENNYMLAKLTEAINRFKTIAEENEIEERRREERRRAWETRRDEEFMRELSKIRGIMNRDCKKKEEQTGADRDSKKRDEWTRGADRDSKKDELRRADRDCREEHRSKSPDRKMVDRTNTQDDRNKENNKGDSVLHKSYTKHTLQSYYEKRNNRH